MKKKETTTTTNTTTKRKEKKQPRKAKKTYSTFGYRVKHFFDSIRVFFFLLKYPFMRPRKVWTGKKLRFPSYSMYDLLPTGWRIAFGKQLLKDLKAALKQQPYDFYFIDIKEKYGTLRLYANVYSTPVQQVLTKYEHMSQEYCISCGDKAEYEYDYYYICSHCFMEEILRGEEITHKKQFNSDAEMFDYMEEFKLPPSSNSDTDDVDKEA